MQAKVFIAYPGALEEEVNTWLSENAAITIVTLQQSVVETDDGPLRVILTIFYT